MKFRNGRGTLPWQMCRQNRFEIPLGTGSDLFFAAVHLHGGPAPVRQYLPRMIELVLNGTIDSGKVFDLTLPLERIAESYRAMDERRAIKTLLTV